MKLSLKTSDRTLLHTLAEHRILQVDQIAALLGRNLAALRRRIRELRDAGLVQYHMRPVSGTRGRPPHLVSVAPGGVEWLRATGAISDEVPTRQVTFTDAGRVEHQLMTNGFRIQLALMTRAINRLTVDFISPDSPFRRHARDHRPIVMDRVAIDKSSDRTVEFIPDGVFAITDQPSKKCLLFFLEVDRSTEPLAGESPSALREKARTYQAYFAAGGYKRYEEIFGAALNGFRLLFLVDTPARLAAVCRLVRGLAPRDFVWVSDEESMVQRGLSGLIWVRGGNQDGPLESIVGPTLAMKLQLGPSGRAGPAAV